MKTAMVIVSLAFVSVAYGQQDSKSEKPVEHHCSMMNDEEKTQQSGAMQHDEMQYEEMMKHGEMAMGFSQTKSTHHFHLSGTGGSIEVQTNNPTDTATRDQIRQHLRQISAMFAEGDFSSPMLTHGRVPPGVPDMQRLKSSLSYTYAETETGAKVLISTASPDALSAVHRFLLFQIEEHKTGDLERVQK